MPKFDVYEVAAARAEAGQFYGLYLRGGKLDLLRSDIDLTEGQFATVAADMSPREVMGLRRTQAFRKQVLRIFDALVRGGLAAA